MKINFDKIQKLVLLTIIFGIICRVIPHPPNFSPVTAIALFGGLNFSDKRVADGLEKGMKETQLFTNVENKFYTTIMES